MIDLKTKEWIGVVGLRVPVYDEGKIVGYEDLHTGEYHRIKD